MNIGEIDLNELPDANTVFFKLFDLRNGSSFPPSY